MIFPLQLVSVKAAPAGRPPERLELSASEPPRPLMSSAQSCVRRRALMFPAQAGRDAFCASVKRHVTAAECMQMFHTHGNIWLAYMD